MLPNHHSVRSTFFADKCGSATTHGFVRNSMYARRSRRGLTNDERVLILTTGIPAVKDFQAVAWRDFTSSQFWLFPFGTLLARCPR